MASSTTPKLILPEAKAVIRTSRCENCKFGVPTPDPQDPRLLCYRNPPHVNAFVGPDPTNGMMAIMNSTVRPLVKAEEWCGEHVPKLSS